MANVTATVSATMPLASVPALVVGFLLIGIVDIGLFEQIREQHGSGFPREPDLIHVFFGMLEATLLQMGHVFVGVVVLLCRTGSHVQLHLLAIRSGAPGRSEIQHFARVVVAKIGAFEVVLVSEERFQVPISIDRGRMIRPWNREIIVSERSYQFDDYFERDVLKH